MKITELVLACFDLSGMLNFYHNVFEISFTDIKIPQGTIHEGHIGEIKFTLCPANIAGITAKDNRHQLTFETNNIKNCIAQVEKFGGSLMGEIQTVNNCLTIAIRDIDGNSIIVQEQK